LGPTVIITGVAGVGKTSILNELQKLSERENVRLKVVNFGTVMKGLLDSAGKSLHRDEIRRENLAIQRRIQIEAAKEISKMRDGGVLVIDTHMFIRTPSGTFPGLPEQVLNEFDPSLLILLEVEPEEIARRRRGDSDRVRDRQTIESVRSDLEWNRRTAAACSVVAGVPVSIVRNEQDKQKEAAREIFEIIKEVTN